MWQFDNHPAPFLFSLRFAIKRAAQTALEDSMRDAFLDVAGPDHVEHPATPVLDLGFAQCLTHTRAKLTVGRCHHDVRRQSAAKKAKARVLAKAQQIIVEFRIGNDAELLDVTADFHGLGPVHMLEPIPGCRLGRPRIACR